MCLPITLLLMVCSRLTLCVSVFLVLVKIFKKLWFWVCKALSSILAPLKEKEKKKESSVAQRPPLLVLNTNVKTSPKCD